MITIRLADVRIDEAIQETIAAMRRGGIVAYPTETFYALGVRFDMPESLRKLYELKKRPREKAMPVIIGDAGLLPQVVHHKWLEEIPSSARSLMDRFWPGPLTLLLPAREGLSEFITSAAGTIAVRIPGESFALNLARKAGFPITATSANLSGMSPPVSSQEVVGFFDDRLDLVIDGGETPGGLPSTIVDATGDSPAIVREGVVGREELENCTAR
jgi:L-threonylcarbamoyladenylate synthase